MWIYNPATGYVVSTESPVYFHVTTSGSDTGLLSYSGNFTPVSIGDFGTQEAAIAALQAAGIGIVEINNPE